VSTRKKDENKTDANVINSSGKQKGDQQTMFKHDKKLLNEVRVDAPNPNYAALLQEQLGVRRAS
jgi:hypothetical protein